MNKYDNKRGIVYKSVGCLLRAIAPRVADMSDKTYAVIGRCDLLKMERYAKTAWEKLGEMKEESITAEVARLRHLYKKFPNNPRPDSNSTIEQICYTAHITNVQPEAVLRYIIEEEVNNEKR